jgi:plastocyanin
MMFLFLLLVSVMIFAACASSPPATPPATTTPGTPAAQSNAVSIESFSFKPAVLTVPVGTTVVWTNNDTAAHNIKSTEFFSNALTKGQTFEFKFDKPGTYDYSCGIHPTMTGQIIVK